jgi:D-3-phosphoglycerate dehydrogenase
MATYTVVLTDQVFPDVTIERTLLASIDAELVIPGDDRSAVMDAAATADAILTTYLPIGADDIARFERAKIIARYGIGVDNIDLVAARAAGIVVTNVPDYSIEEVAVHTLTIMLAAVRHLPAAMAQASSGRWSIDAVRPIERFSESTIGVVGLGRIGRRVVSLLRPFEARLVGFDPYASGAIDGVEVLASLTEVLSVSDIVTLHLPVNAETRGMIGAEQLASMRPHAILVNTSRGGLVRTGDLVDALRAGGIGGAALDVLDREVADAPAFAGLANVILTPHMAYYSESALRESQRKATTQIIKVLGGEAPDYPVG